MSGIVKTTADQTPVQTEDDLAQPIVIRQLDRLETTYPTTNGGS